MLDRLYRRRAGLGSDVTVLAGPFAGHSGRITAIGPDATFRVTIDDCCQPFVAAADLRVVKARSLGDKGPEAEATVARNPEGEYVQQQGEANVPYGDRPF